MNQFQEDLSPSYYRSASSGDELRSQVSLGHSIVPATDCNNLCRVSLRFPSFGSQTIGKRLVSVPYQSRSPQHTPTIKRFSQRPPLVISKDARVLPHVRTISRVHPASQTPKRPFISRIQCQNQLSTSNFSTPNFQARLPKKYVKLCYLFINEKTIFVVLFVFIKNFEPLTSPYPGFFL